MPIAATLGLLFSTLWFFCNLAIECNYVESAGTAHLLVVICHLIKNRFPLLWARPFASCDFGRLKDAFDCLPPFSLSSGDIWSLKSIYFCLREVAFKGDNHFGAQKDTTYLAAWIKGSTGHQRRIASGVVGSAVGQPGQRWLILRGIDPQMKSGI